MSKNFAASSQRPLSLVFAIVLAVAPTGPTLAADGAFYEVNALVGGRTSTGSNFTDIIITSIGIAGDKMYVSDFGSTAADGTRNSVVVPAAGGSACKSFSLKTAGHPDHHQLCATVAAQKAGSYSITVQNTSLPGDYYCGSAQCSESETIMLTTRGSACSAKLVGYRKVGVDQNDRLYSVPSGRATEINCATGK